MASRWNPALPKPRTFTLAGIKSRPFRASRSVQWSPVQISQSTPVQKALTLFGITGQ